MPSKHDPEGRRQLAKDAGHATYDTGVPCKNGHKSPRYTATTTCAECKKDTFAKAYAKDKNRRLGYAAKWRDLNRDAVNLYAKEYREKFPEKVRETVKKSAEKRRPYKAMQERARLAKKKRSTPLCLSSIDIKDIKDIYAKAAFLSKEYGVKMHVDHIVPLNGKTVCGLHVPWNLQILAQKENCAKHARLTEDAYRPVDRGIMYGKSALPWNRGKYEHRMEN
jgi:5-methylcytosine-specific restriction endonuclease McrA